MAKKTKTKATRLLYNDDGTRVDERIEKGETFYYPFTQYNALEARRKAEEKAKEIKSFPYEVFNRNGIQTGYAVSK